MRGDMANQGIIEDDLIENSGCGLMKTRSLLCIKLVIIV